MATRSTSDSSRARSSCLRSSLKPLDSTNLRFTAPYYHVGILPGRCPSPLLPRPQASPPLPAAVLFLLSFLTVTHLLLALMVTTTGGVPWPSVDYSPKHGACRAPPPDTARTVLGIRARKSAMDEAERVLGPSPRSTEGDGGEWKAWRCWKASNGDGTILYVGRSDVSGYVRVYGREMDFPGRAACPASPLVHRGISTGTGLRLGLSRAEVTAVLGNQAVAGDRVVWASCQASRPPTEVEKVARKVPGGIEQLDIGAVINAVVVGDKVAGFEIIWTETY
jgi:hypothetical protein